MNCLSEKDIEFIKYYEDQSDEGSYGDYFWEYIPNFDISLMGSSEDWVSWIEDESKSFIDEFGYDKYGEIKEWWLNTPEKEPIIVVQQENKEYFAWDGNHRIGISFSCDMRFIPAFVGINKQIKG